MKTALLLAALMGLSAAASAQDVCSFLAKADSGVADLKVTTGVAKDGECIGFGGDMVASTNTITIKQCAAGLYCDSGTKGKCQTAAKHGDACDTGNTACKAGADAKDSLTCGSTSKKCQYRSYVGDGCVNNDDCTGGGQPATCTGSVCVGAVDADGDCDATAAKACKKGLRCVSAKCKKYLAVDATCTDSTLCPGGTVCAGASGAMKCVLTGSQAVGTETGTMAACMNMGYDATTKKCTADRTGGTVASGGACSKSSECKMVTESCGSCTGGGKGKCRALQSDGIYATDMAAYYKCQSTSDCAQFASSTNSMSCLVKACGVSRAGCAGMTVMWDLNGGAAPSDANLAVMKAERPQCTDGAATTTVSLMAVLAAVAVALRLA